MIEGLSPAISSIDVAEDVCCICKAREEFLFFQLKSLALTFLVIAGNATLIPSISLDILI